MKMNERSKKEIKRRSESNKGKWKETKKGIKRKEKNKNKRKNRIS
jgi:hypothetical protein